MEMAQYNMLCSLFDWLTTFFSLFYKTFLQPIPVEKLKVQTSAVLFVSIFDTCINHEHTVTWLWSERCILPILPQNESKVLQKLLMSEVDKVSILISVLHFPAIIMKDVTVNKTKVVSRKTRMVSLVSKCGSELNVSSPIFQHIYARFYLRNPP